MPLPGLSGKHSMQQMNLLRAAFATSTLVPRTGVHRPTIGLGSCQLVPKIFRCLQLPRARITSSLSSDDASENIAKAAPKNSIAENSQRFKRIRQALALISIAGVFETSYLTLNKLFSSPGAICSTQGCLDVLSGAFSTFMGIPLTLFGTLAYSAFAYLCLWPLSANDEEVEAEDGKLTVVLAENVYISRDAVTRPLMLALSTILVVFSGYLMSLLYFVIHSMCPYCLFSAGLSSLLFVLTVFGRTISDWRKALNIGFASTFAAGGAAALMFFVSLPGHLRAQPPSGPQSPPAITRSSTQDSLRLAKKLSQKRAKMYGAFWCSHCYDQKQRFGRKAFAKLQYVECDKYGVDTKYQLCREKRIPGYPTWEIDGELYPGEIDLPELERIVDESIAAGK